MIFATAIILFACSLIRSAVGFGDALLAMPLLGLVISLQVASPIVAFAGFTISLLILLIERDAVDFKSAWRLIIATIVGVPFGLLLLNYAPEHLVKGVLSLVLILYRPCIAMELNSAEQSPTPLVFRTVHETRRFTRLLDRLVLVTQTSVPLVMAMSMQ